MTAHDEPLPYRETREGHGPLRLTVSVDEDAVRVRLWPVDRSYRTIPLDRIDAATVEDYDPGSAGTWEWGTGVPTPEAAAYRIDADRGVRLRLDDDGTVFLGAGDPERLYRAIRRGLAGTT